MVSPRLWWTTGITTGIFLVRNCFFDTQYRIGVVAAFQTISVRLLPSRTNHGCCTTLTKSNQWKQELHVVTVSTMHNTSEKSSESIDSFVQRDVTSIEAKRNDTILPYDIMTHPLPPQTFAGQVEIAMKHRFGTNGIERVLASWRLAYHNYEHQQYVGTSMQTSPGQSNCHQVAHSYVPGLHCCEFWDPNDTRLQPWIKKLQKSYNKIFREFQGIMSRPELLHQTGNNIWTGALTEDATDYGIGWKTLVLMDRGKWDPINANIFPDTSQAVYKSGIPATEVFFASMEPHSTIKKHTDNTNFVLTSHLGLDIPYSGSNQCRLTIGDTTRQWHNGEILVFDTSIIHDAVNESDRTRYILMFRLWHPDLSTVEQQALQFSYDCLDYPALLSEDRMERETTEAIVQSAKAFPKLERAKKIRSGFHTQYQ
jgi:hypothetical protein